MAIDLRTSYLGFELRSPLLASASPLTSDIKTLQRLEQAGAGAVVLPSLFEEQIEHEELAIHSMHALGAESVAEAAGYFPDLGDYNTGPGRYLALIAEARRRLSIPIIASLNGASPGGWARYARHIEEAGADALELNIYFVAANPDLTGSEVEERYIRLVEYVRKSVQIPLAVKIGPQFSSLPHMARRLAGAGADGLVLFNRFVAPDINLDTLEVVPHLALSRPEEMALALRWIAILKGQVNVSLAATGGVHDHTGAAKVLLAGADVVQIASVLLREGPERLGVITEGLRQWLEEREYASVAQMKGSMSQANCPDPAAFERGNYMRALVNWSPQV